MADDYSGYQREAEVAKNYLAKSISLGSMRNPPVRSIVEQQIADYEKQIEIRKELLAKLDANKGVEEVLDILRKVGI